LKPEPFTTKRVWEEGTVELNAIPRRFEHHSFWLSATVEENELTSGSGCATTIRFWAPWAGSNGGGDDKGQEFTVQGRAEHHEFFQLMQRIGRALGYLDPEPEGRF
jgi:hypothetical protein